MVIWSQASDDGFIIPGDRQPLGGGRDTGDLPPGGLLLPLDAHTIVVVLVDTVAPPEKAAGESNVSSREDMPLARYYRSYEGVKTRGAD